MKLFEGDGSEYGGGVFGRYGWEGMFGEYVSEYLYLVKLTEFWLGYLWCKC